MRPELRPLSAFSIANRQGLAKALDNFLKNAGKTNSSQQSLSGDASGGATENLNAQVPTWPDHVRAAPNDLLRRAIFSARNRKESRRDFASEPIPGADRTVAINLVGEELRQVDLRTWLQVLHLMRGRIPGDVVTFSAYSMIRQIGGMRAKPNSGHKDRLWKSLCRLRDAVISIRVRGAREAIDIRLISLIDVGSFGPGSVPKWRVALDPNISHICSQEAWTWLDWSIHQQLSVGLASWLHGYFASHSKPKPIKLATIKSASGSQTEAPARFAQLVREALEELKCRKFLADWEICGDLVCVVRTCST